MARPAASPATSLAEVSRAIRPVTLAHEQVVPVLPALAGLVPDGGLARGSVVVVDGDRAGTSLALAVVAGPSQAGSWVAVVGCPDLGLAAAAEAGVVLERLALVSATPESWPTVVAALIGAVDVVMVSPTHRVRAADARRLAARARERGTILVQTGSPVRPSRSAGADLEADLRLTVTGAEWQGVGHGHGHLQVRRLTVEAGGRRRAARPRRVELWFPDGRGEITPVIVEPPAEAPFESYAGSDVERLVG